MRKLTQYNRNCSCSTAAMLQCRRNFKKSKLISDYGQTIRPSVRRAFCTSAAAFCAAAAPALALSLARSHADCKIEAKQRHDDQQRPPSAVLPVDDGRDKCLTHPNLRPEIFCHRSDRAQEGETALRPCILGQYPCHHLTQSSSFIHRSV